MNKQSSSDVECLPSSSKTLQNAILLHSKHWKQNVIFQTTASSSSSSSSSPPSSSSSFFSEKSWKTLERTWQLLPHNTIILSQLTTRFWVEMKQYGIACCRSISRVWRVLVKGAINFSYTEGSRDRLHVRLREWILIVLTIFTKDNNRERQCLC